MTSYQHQICATSKCNNEPHSLCYCCQRNYCVRHLIEHNDLFNPQLNFLFQEINKLDDQIKTLNIQQIIGNCYRKLEQRRTDYHLKIDHFFEQKCHEVDRLINEKIDYKRIEVNRLQSAIAKLIAKQKINNEEFDSLRINLDELRAEINDLEQIHNQVNIHPLALDDDLINIKNKFNLSTLPPIWKTINHPHGSYGVLANNNQFMLIYLEPNLVLIDKELITVKQVPWPYDTIWNICWSSALDCFLIIEKNNIYLVDHQTMFIKNLQVIERRKWYSCTCSDTSLFLSTNEINPSIVEFNLLPSIKLVQQWTSPYTCKNNEYINDIVYNNSTLAIMITNNIEKSVRLELRSSETLQRIWSFRLVIERNPNKPFRCCSINSNEWLVADYQNRHLLHITKDGDLKKMLTYNDTPFYVVSFDSDILAISRQNGINFHKL